MTSNNAPRVLVVGGGPTGSATAIALRREVPGAHVTLVDKATFPRDKTCGDGLGPGARRVLDGLGLSDRLREFHMPMSVAISGPGGVEAFARGPIMEGRDLAGYVTPRIALDDLLLGAARDAGAEVREGVSFEGMTPVGAGPSAAGWRPTAAANGSPCPTARPLSISSSARTAPTPGCGAPWAWDVPRCGTPTSPCARTGR